MYLVNYHLLEFQNFSINIFTQESNGGIYQMLWNGMQEFDRQGRPAVSTDHSMHLDMVDEGGLKAFSNKIAILVFAFLNGPCICYLE